VKDGTHWIPTCQPGFAIVHRHNGRRDPECVMIQRNAPSVLLVDRKEHINGFVLSILPAHGCHEGNDAIMYAGSEVFNAHSGKSTSSGYRHSREPDPVD
jgi:hypothetical protein